MRKGIVAVLCVVTALATAPARAETEHGTGTEGTTYSLGAGYRWIGNTGSSRADEFEYQRDSWTLGGEAAFIGLPHRLFLDFDMKNNEDFFGDGSYGYRDLLLLRVVNSTGYHNLAGIPLIDPDPAGDSAVDVRNPATDYFLEYSITRASVRLKTPNFPFHLYALGDVVQKNGLVEQRSLLGAGYFNDRVRTSQRRDVDWQTVAYTVGANSHLGPIEVDVSHREKRFDPSNDKVLADDYGQAGFGTDVIRGAGTYRHSSVPETKGSATTLKVHTSHAGKIVAAATFAIKDRDNENNGATADVFVGNGAITWLPTTKIAFYGTYAHRELDLDNPDSVTVADLGDPGNTYGNALVRPSISSSTDKFSVSGRFQLIPRTTVRAGYAYQESRRDDGEAWSLPDSTHRHIATATVDTRPHRTLNAKLQYTYRGVIDPAYNTEPDDSNEGRFTLTWTPFPRVIAMGQYGIAVDDRDNLHFVDNDGSFEIPGDRNATRDHVIATLTLLLMDDLTVTGNYAYLHNKIEQDIVYHSDMDPFARMIDDDVPYKTTAFNYGVNVRYALDEKLTLGGSVNLTLTRGLFLPDTADLVQPVDVSSMSRLKVREMMYGLSGEYAWGDGLRLMVDYRYTGFNDVLDNVADDIQDSTIQIIWVGFSKRFG